MTGGTSPLGALDYYEFGVWAACNNAAVSAPRGTCQPLLVTLPGAHHHHHPYCLPCTTEPEDLCALPAALPGADHQVRDVVWRVVCHTRVCSCVCVCSVRLAASG
jgi:hypothetical protein